MNNSRLKGAFIAVPISCAIAIIFSFFPINVNAAIVNYNFSWTGVSGYSVQGNFSYDDAAGLGPVVDETELSSFSATAYTPTSDALNTYNLTNQDMFFNFNFDVSSMTILQSGSSDTNLGFSIGEFYASGTTYLDDPNKWEFTTFVGCGSTFPGVDIGLLQIDGGCNGRVLDQDGTAFTVSSAAAVPLPPGLWLFGSGLLGLIDMARRKAA